MNLLIIAIIIIVIGFVVGPLLLLKPTIGQKNSIHNREAARQKGILLQMVKLDAPHWMENAQDMCMQYYLLKNNSDYEHQNLDYWQIEPNKWVDNLRYLCSDLVNKKLQDLPNPVYRVTLNEQMVAVYINDAKIDKNTNQINQVIDFLQKNA